jgi:hypothetical protein
LFDIDETLVASKSEKLENGTYKENASTTKVDLDALIRYFIYSLHGISNKTIHIMNGFFLFCNFTNVVNP